MTQLASTANHSLTPDQLRLVKTVVAKGATDDELKLFLYRCHSLGLDPLKPGQIHFIKYGNGPGTIVVGIDGFRARAQATGQMGGVEREIIRNAEGQCLGARARVYRKDWDKPAVIEVSLAEYSTGKGPWAKMPETMIGKVAEAAALRMAFPDQLGGMYTKEEMDQAEKERGNGPGRILAEQPGPDDGVQETNGYRVDFGQWNGRSLEELSRDPKVGPKRIADYIDYLENNSAKQNKPLGQAGIRFIKEAELFLAALESGESEFEPGSEG